MLSWCEWVIRCFITKWKRDLGKRQITTANDISIIRIYTDINTTHWTLQIDSLMTPHPTLDYATLPYPTLPWTTLPYPTLPYPALPCPTLPYPTLPYPTPPHPTLPYLIFSYHSLAALTLHLPCPTLARRDTSWPYPKRPFANLTHQPSP